MLSAERRVREMRSPLIASIFGGVFSLFSLSCSHFILPSSIPASTTSSPSWRPARITPTCWTSGAVHGRKIGLWMQGTASPRRHYGGARVPRAHDTRRQACAHSCRHRCGLRDNSGLRPDLGRGSRHHDRIRRRGLTTGFLVIALYVIFRQFENHLIYPLVVTRVVGVPPILVILALIVGAQLAYFLGILLSVPIAAIIQEFVRDVRGPARVCRRTRP